jgi:hypothetical protein
LLPYLTKLFIIFILNIPYDSPRSTYFREVVNMFGDFLNLGLTTLLVLLFVGPLTLQPLNCIFYLPIAAELIRILAERYTYPLKYVDEVLMKQLRTESRG